MSIATEPTPNDNLAYTITEDLTTEVGPRLAGSPADQRAVDWSVNKMQSLGFDKVWIEQFRTPYWQRGFVRMEILSPYPQNITVTALGGSISTPEHGIDGSIVLFDSLEQLMISDKEQVSGKIVFINRIMLKNDPKSGYGPVVAGRSKGAIEAAKLGAKALIIRSVGTSSHRFAHTGNMDYEVGVPQIPAVAISVPDAEQLARILKRSPEAQVKLVAQTFSQDGISHNVIGEITGSESPNEIVLIGAHLDSWDLGTGALDDGAGVGLVIATAILTKQKSRPKRTIRVVLYGNEEGGLIGARAYAAKHAHELNQYVLVSESDLGAGRIYRFDTSFGPQALQFAEKIQQKLQPLGIERGDNKANGGPDVSVLKALGVPAVSLRQDGTDYFDYHHTADDTIDKIDKAAYAQNLAAWQILVDMAANHAVDFRR